MSNIKHTYIPLTKATIVDRRHERDIEPPGMVNLENFLPSRSDDCPTLRPDLLYTSDTIYGISTLLTVPETSTIRDCLNSANGLYGSEQVTFFTRYVPYGNDNGTWRVLSGTHDDGTVAISSGQSVITGIDTRFLEHAHRGAIIRVPAGAAGAFSGAPHVFIESGTTSGEWYLAELDGTELDLIADELYYLSPGFGGSSATYQIGTIGSLTTRKAVIGDNDTLGFSALYVKIDGNDPDTWAENGAPAFTLETCTNISGSNTMWNASGSGTNEYYLTTRASGDPFAAIIGGYESDGTVYYRFANAYVWTSIDFDRYYYRKNTASTIISEFSSEQEATDIAEGTLGSLANLQANYGDNDALGFSTLYVRDNGGSPDVISTAKSDYTFKLPFYYEMNTSGYKWVPATSDTNGFWYKLQTTAGGDPSVSEPEFAVSYNVSSTASTELLERDSFVISTGWRYGDFDSDGYSTIYLNYGRSDPDSVSSNIKFRFYYYEKIVNSNYSWVASATSNEYYLAQQDGTEITADFDEPYSVIVGDYYQGEGSSGIESKGVIGSLADGQWGYGKLAGDSLTYDTIYIRSNSGDPDTLNLKVIARYRHQAYSSKYKWVASGTANEYYIVKWDGTTATDPSIGEPTSLEVNGVSYTYNTGGVGALSADEYDYGDNDALGYNTIYIYSTSDPNGAVGTGLEDEDAPFVIGSESSTESYDYYVIDSIIDDETAYIWGEANTSVSGVQPTIYYNHNPFLSDYKLNIQAYTSGLIYNGPTIRDDVSDEDICGPFYADLLKGEWAYGGKILTDYSFTGTGVLFEKQNSLATNGYVYLQIFPTVDDFSDTDQPEAAFLGQTYGLTNNAWTRKDFSDLTISGDGTTMRLNSIQASGTTFLCAAQVISGSACYPGIAYSTDNYGLVWVTQAITSIDGNSTAWADSTGATRAQADYQAISAAWNGSSPGRIVILVVSDIGNNNFLWPYYSDDSGATWTGVSIDGSAVPSASGDETRAGAAKVRYINGQFVILDGGRVLYGDGSSFTTGGWNRADTELCVDIAFDGDDNYVILNNDFTVQYTSDLTTNGTTVSLPLDTSAYSDETAHIMYDSIGERFVINTGLLLFWSEDGITWSSEYISTFGEAGSFKAPTNVIEDVGGLTTTLYDGGADYLRNARFSRYNYTYWNVVDFVPLSDIYRASTFSVLDGYVVLLGTREYDDDADTWTYYPRRIRWTAPATYNDFSSEGSGTADANGEGVFLDSRPVNGRIVAFETNRVSAIVPRGDVEDPWDYDVIKEDFRILSNPVTVDDQCYVIGTDGLLYICDGINVAPSGSSFDVSKYDDFTEEKPIILDYSRALNSLVVYNFDPSADNHYCYFISISNGSVTKIEIPEQTDANEPLAVEPAFVTCVSDSSDQRVLFSYHPLSTANDKVVTTSLATGAQISGRDVPIYFNASDDATYWYGTLETGELYLVPEGSKTSLKHIIVRTYSDTPGDNTDRPRIVAQIRSLEDTEWHTCGQVDEFSEYSLTTVACTTSAEGSAAFTNLMAEGSGAGGATISVLPPVDARSCRFYKKTGSTYTLQVEGTDYTTSDSGSGKYQATFTSNSPPAGTDLYAYWENYPEIRVDTGDFYLSNIGVHRVTGTTGTNATGGLTLDHYPDGPGTSGIHYPSAQIPDGYGEVKIGVNKMVEGFKLRLLVVPEYGASSAPTIVKITGIVFGHIPQGRKILQPTGS